MNRSLASTARSLQVNTVDRALSVGKPKAARLDLDCQDRSIADNGSVQAGDSTLALIDETFVSLGWKRHYVATVIGVDPALFSRAISEKDRKTFDVRWLSKLPAEFWVAFTNVVIRKFSITQESRQELLLDAICGHLESLKTLVRQTVVSE